jgi:hypothetical protein
MTSKEEILLSLLNEILSKQNKPLIGEITEFVMEKEELIKEDNYSIIEGKYDEIFKYYQKDNSHYRRALCKNYIIVLLKNMCKQVNLKWTSKEIDRGEIVNGEKYRKRRSHYFINNM